MVVPLLAVVLAGITFDPYKHVIWIPVQIDGGAMLEFGFDSAAAVSAIEWNRAEEQKIPFTSLGERLNAGSGDGLARTGRTGAVRLRLPGVVLELPAMGVVPLRGVSETYGRRMDGLVGAELLARYVVELDWEERKMILHEPGAYRYAGKGTSLPLIVAGGMPFLKATVSVPGAKPVEGVFLVDCPHPGTIIMNTPFVRDNALLDGARREGMRIVAQYAEGVGGKSAVLHGRVRELAIGPYVLRDPVVGFSQAKAGSLARAEFAGILGAEVLRRFRVIFDFSREQLILEPKGSLSQAFRYDASGLQLRSTGDDFRTFRVTGVVEGSPAEKAKLREGDRLVEIEGKAASGMSLGEILDVLKQDGKIVKVKVQRGDEQVEAELALRSLL